MKTTWQAIVRWLDTWNEYPSHALTLGLVILVLGTLAFIFAWAAT
jgi:hypothetical protein